MRLFLRSAAVWTLGCALLAGLAATAEAKKFRYASGPKAPDDTTYSVADIVFEPIVRTRGPRVPATNFQMTALVARAAFERAMADAPVGKGRHVVLAPSGDHPMNFVVEHVVLRELARREATAEVRRSPVPDDSVAVIGGADPILEYQVASARVTYLRLRGWLPGRVQIERQALVEGQMSLRDPVTRRVLWTGAATHNLLDAFPRGQLPLVEDERYTDLKSEVPDRNVDKVFEPVIVVGIVTGLILLFFQNRP